jgi:hypothetical protein
VCEFLGRNPRYKVDRIATIEKLDGEAFINNIVLRGFPLARLEHTFQQTPGGTHFEHFLIVPGSQRFGLLGQWAAARLFSQAQGEAWLKHAIEEMGALEHFLPQLYEREARGQDQIAPRARKEFA